VQNKKRQNQAFWSETIVDGNASLGQDATAEEFGKDPAIGENIDTILGKVETKLGSVSVHRLLGFDRASKQKGWLVASGHTPPERNRFAQPAHSVYSTYARNQAKT
jgi:hypothetical protein